MITEKHKEIIKEFQKFSKNYINHFFDYFLDFSALDLEFSENSSEKENSSSFTFPS